MKNVIYTQHHLIQDAKEIFSKAGFKVEAYQNSLKISHKYFDFAIFIQKNWLNFAGIFRAKATYEGLKRLVQRIYSYIHKKFREKFTNKLKQFKSVIDEFLATNKIKYEESKDMNEREKKRLEEIKKYNEYFDKNGYNKKADLEYRSKTMGSNLYFEIAGLLNFSFKDGKITVRKLWSVTKEQVNDIVNKFLNFFNIKKDKISIMVYERKSPEHIKALSMI